MVTKAEIKDILDSVANYGQITDPKQKQEVSDRFQEYRGEINGYLLGLTMDQSSKVRDYEGAIQRYEYAVLTDAAIKKKESFALYYGRNRKTGKWVGLAIVVIIIGFAGYLAYQLYQNAEDLFKEQKDRIEKETIK